jgi:predicted dehydrogenase
VVWDRTLHDVDLLRALLHLSVREVYVRSTQGPPAGDAGPEEIVGHLVMTGGLVVQIHDSFVQSHVPVLLELYGANGSIAALDCDPMHGQAAVSLRRGEAVQEVAAPRVQPFRAVVANFLAAVRGEAALLADGGDELQNLAAVEAVAAQVRGVRG